MTMTANPFTLYDVNDNPYDTVIIAGWRLPGIAKVGQPKRTFKWDKKEAPGTAGDSITYRGSRLVDAVIELHWWDPAQADDWDTNVSTIEPDGKSGLDVIHPTFERLKMKSVVVTEIVPPYHAGKGEWVVQIGVTEYKPPPKANATKTPDGSKASGGASGANGSATQPTAKSAQEQEIERLMAEAKKP